MQAADTFELKFTDQEITAWGGLALLKQMLDTLGFKEAVAGWGLPPPGSNRGFNPVQLIEQMMVSIWCGAARFVHADITRLDTTLARLFGWKRVAGHKAIIRLFERFDIARATDVHEHAYRWLFNKLALKNITLDVDSTVIPRWGKPQGACVGYNPKHHGRASHHPLLAFVSDWRLVANFWLRPGNAHTANNMLAFMEQTLTSLGDTVVGLFRADSGFYDKAILGYLEEKKIHYIVSAKLTRALQSAIFAQRKWQSVADGIEIAELPYQALGWEAARRMIVVRQRMVRNKGSKAAQGGKDKNNALAGTKANGKTMSLFPDEPDLEGLRFSAMVTDLRLPALEVWRMYRGRADCENRIKELKQDFGLNSFVLKDFWATEAALGVAMLAYNLMSVFRHTVLRERKQATLSTLHHKVLAVGAYWSTTKSGQEMGKKPILNLAISRKRRAWFEGLWAHAFEPVEPRFMSG
jgi:Transposase DDE domain group 1